MDSIILMKEVMKLLLHPKCLHVKNYYYSTAGLDTPLLLLSRSYPTLFNTCPKESLVCDACEFAKHTRVHYPSLGLRSNRPFDVIHSDVWVHVRCTLFLATDGF